MSKQNFLILILIIIIIFLLVFGVFIFTPLKNFFIRPVTQEQLIEKRLSDVKIYETALAQNDSGLCKKIDNLSTRDLCWEKMATQKQDTAICKNINSELDKNRCIYAIIKEKALVAKNLEICNELVEEVLIDRCKQQLLSTDFCADEECLSALNK